VVEISQHEMARAYPATREIITCRQEAAKSEARLVGSNIFLPEAQHPGHSNDFQGFHQVSVLDEILEFCLH
jgi:hypothetical protein